MNGISDRFKIVRQNANMTQKEFGAAIGITQNMVSQIEKNSRAPSERTKMLVCKVFGITETWMDSGEGPMYTEPTEADELAQLLQGASPTKALLLRIIASLPDYLLADLRREIRQIMRKLPPQPPDEE